MHNHLLQFHQILFKIPSWEKLIFLSVLGQRLEELALALFLVMTGALWLAPDAWIPEGTWLAGVGLILRGRNIARYFHGLSMHGLGIVVGIAALIEGIWERR